MQHPTEDCEPKALTIVDETLDKFPKLDGGLGGYALDVAQSKAACAARACTQKDLPRGATAQAKVAVNDQGVAVESKEADEFASLHEPPNGWGMGPHPEWRERSTITDVEAV